MSILSRDIQEEELSKELREKLYSIVRKGLKLNAKIIDSKEWNSEIKYEISMYLLSCEECVEALGAELPRHHCEMRSKKELFSTERLFIVEFLYGRLNDSMFE